MEGADAAKETVAKVPEGASAEPNKQASSPAKETASVAEPKSGEPQTIAEPKSGEPQTHEGDERSSEPQTQEEDQSMDDVVAGLANVASGWLSGWMKSLEVAKYKSVEVYDMVKKDLGEFTDAVQAETSTMLSSTSQSLRETLQLQDESSAAGQVKKSVSGFLTHVQKAFTPDTMQDDDTEAYVLRDGQPVLLDRLQTELHRLAADPHTYLEEPAEAERARYEAWSAELDLEARQAELSDLLASSRTILDQYTRLVPAEVSHVLFWHRYLFRVHLAEERERQRHQLRKRADQMTAPGQAEKQITWEEDSDEKTGRTPSGCGRAAPSAGNAALPPPEAGGLPSGAAPSHPAPAAEDFSHHVEVTDAQADQLLAEYDRECQQRPQTGSGSGSRSPEHASSNDDDWVKEDIDAETNSSVGNDWEKWE